MCPTLNAFDNATESRATVLFTQNQRGEVRDLNGLAGSLQAEPGSQQTNYLRAGGVRRLTPLECERLMGLPDNWTEGHADSVRYRQCGNAVVAEWIGYLLEENA